MNLSNGINSSITFDLYASGYCISNASVVNPSAPRQKVRFYAVWGHIYHPRFGHILVDTGYNSQFTNCTNHFPERFYKWATPVMVREDETAAAILHKKGIAAGEIRYIIITHFHADHICALNDFPQATFVCSKDALEQVNRLTGFSAVRKGIIKSLLPADFAQRVVTVEDTAQYTDLLDGDIRSFSFFDSPDIRLVYLPGHASGMLGVLINAAEREIFYASDAQWDKSAYEAGILPRKIVKVFFDSWTAFKDTTAKLKHYMAAHPDTLLLFTHCRQTLDYVNNDV